MAIEIDNFFPDRYRYFHVPVWDEPDVNIMDFFGKCANRSIRRARRRGGGRGGGGPRPPDSLVSDYDQCELPHALTENSRLAKVVAGSLW